MAKIPPFDPIEFLIECKHPVIARLLAKYGNSRGGIFGDPPPETYTLADLEFSDIKDKREVYRKELKTKTPDEIEALINVERARLSAEHQAKADLEEQGRFYNQQGATADFEHWSRASYWTIEEAVCLSLGKAPEVVSKKKLEPFRSTSQFANAYFRLIDLANRAVWAKQLWEPVYPTIFLAWAARMAIPVAPGLKDAVEARGLQIADWKTLYDDLAAANAKRKAAADASFADLKASSDSIIAGFEEVKSLDEQTIAALRQQIEALEVAPKGEQSAPTEKSLSARERDSLLKILIGMAVKGYGFDFLAKRSDQIKEIVDDLAKAGVPVSDDTVRKYLREAADLLPPPDP